MENKVAIIGYSGHAFVVLDAAKKMGMSIIGYCDLKENTSLNVYKLGYLGNENQVGFDWQQVDGYILGVGDNRLRNQIAENILKNKQKLLTVIHPSSTINDWTSIGEGSFVSSNAIINPLSEIGRYAVVNSGAIIEHECIVQDGAHIAPGAVLAGNVRVGRNSFIGANSVVRQGISIGNDVVVGAGSVVVKDIPDGETWVGNPAKFLWKTKY